MWQSSHLKCELVLQAAQLISHLENICRLRQERVQGWDVLAYTKIKGIWCRNSARRRRTFFSLCDVSEMELRLYIKRATENKTLEWNRQIRFAKVWVHALFRTNPVLRGKKDGFWKAFGLCRTGQSVRTPSQKLFKNAGVLLYWVHCQCFGGFKVFKCSSGHAYKEVNIPGFSGLTRLEPKTCQFWGIFSYIKYGFPQTRFTIGHDSQDWP